MEGLLHDRFKIERELGRGGMGVVVKAHDTLLDRPVAIKVISRELLDAGGMEANQIIQRFLIEARAAAKLAHPNVVTLYDVVDAKPPYIVMEFVDGHTVRDLVEASGPFELSKACDICAQVARGLQAAHVLGMVHRDIKPENVIVSGDKAKILDFGLAQLQKLRGATKKEPVLGTPGYMAPEQILGEEATPSSDIFATACVFVYSLVGKDLFEGNDVKEILTKVVKVDPDLSEIPVGASLRPVLTRALSKDPKDRPSAEELAQAMELARTEAPDRYSDFFTAASTGQLEEAASVPGIATYDTGTPEPAGLAGEKTRVATAGASSLPGGWGASQSGSYRVAASRESTKSTTPPGSAAASTLRMPASVTQRQGAIAPSVPQTSTPAQTPKLILYGVGLAGLVFLAVLALWLLSQALR